MDNLKNISLDTIDEISDIICKLSDKIWDNPETAFLEMISCELQCEVLEKLGFEVSRNLGNIPTAFCGSYGSGKPVIAILGEFDALSGLSQKANQAIQEPLILGNNGHGCGHNLLGSGSIASAYAIKEYLKKSKKQGTVIYFGCPGEEGGSGKAFMVRDGVFDDVDIALSWHPMDYNCTWYESTLANYQVKYKFSGVSAHAAAAPHLGRSALDAVELMNIGVQFLREHVLDEVRIHYAITNAGGLSPNVVQSKAEVLYLIRAPKTIDVQATYERVNDIARGAALMSGTSVEIEFIKACSNVVINQTLADQIQLNLENIPLYSYTKEELSFAKQICDSIENKSDSIDKLCKKLKKNEADLVRLQANEPISNIVIPRIYDSSVSPFSSDVGDVSWKCPTAQVITACWPTSTPAHSWQVVAVGKHSLAKKGMLYAAKIIAGTAIDLLENPQLIENAKKEHIANIGDKPFVSPIPKDIKPQAIK